MRTGQPIHIEEVKNIDVRARILEAATLQPPAVAHDSSHGHHERQRLPQ